MNAETLLSIKIALEVCQRNLKAVKSMVDRTTVYMGEASTNLDEVDTFIELALDDIYLVVPNAP